MVRIFKNVFHAYNFSIISNLFNSNKPYQHACSKMCAQNASYFAKHSESGSKNLNTFCLKIIQKALKIAIQHVNFQNFSGEACPRTALKLFLFLNQLQICSAEKMWKSCLHPFKILSLRQLFMAKKLYMPLAHW